MASTTLPLLREALGAETPEVPLRTFAGLCRRLSLKPGDLLYAEGDSLGEMFVVDVGEVHLVAHGSTVNTVKRAAVLGHEALLIDPPPDAVRTASAVAATAAVVLVAHTSQVKPHPAVHHMHNPLSAVCIALCTTQLALVVPSVVPVVPGGASGAGVYGGRKLEAPVLSAIRLTLSSVRVDRR